MGQQGTGSRKIKTAYRVFDVLELVREQNGVTLSEVADEVGMATSTAHGYVTTLEELGYIVREDDQFYGRVPNSSRVVTDSCGNRVTSGTYPEVTHARHNRRASHG